jgi:hypothetical protein
MTNSEINPGQGESTQMSEMGPKPELISWFEGNASFNVTKVIPHEMHIGKFDATVKKFSEPEAGEPGIEQRTISSKELLKASAWAMGRLTELHEAKGSNLMTEEQRLRELADVTRFLKNAHNILISSELMFMTDKGIRI